MTGAALEGFREIEMIINALRRNDLTGNKPHSC